MLAIKLEKYKTCLDVCVKKTITMKMGEDKSWFIWSGYRDFNIKMNFVPKYNKEKGSTILLLLPRLLFYWALIRVKQVNTKHDGGLHSSSRQYHVYDHAVRAIHHHGRYLNQILCFNVKYKADSGYTATTYTDQTKFPIMKMLT